MQNFVALAPSPCQEPVVVIEDDPEMRELLGMFMIDEGYDVRLMGTGEEFLHYLEKNNPPRVVLLDLSLPQLSGAEILGILNQRPDRSKIKIIAASAWDDIDVRAQDCGADGFIRKPLDLEKLADVLAEAFAK